MTPSENQANTELNPSSKGFDFGDEKFIRAMVILLNDISKNPRKYFGATYETHSNYGKVLNVKLKKDLISRADSAFPKFKKHSKRTKIDLYNCSLNGITKKGTNSFNMYIKGNSLRCRSDLKRSYNSENSIVFTLGKKYSPEF